jgi:hypothetical protein
MRVEIEAARRREQRTRDLAVAAHRAREQVALYKATTEGAALTSFARLRHLEQARDGAEARLRRAQEAPDDDLPHSDEDLSDPGGEPIEPDRDMKR